MAMNSQVAELPDDTLPRLGEICACTRLRRITATPLVHRPFRAARRAQTPSLGPESGIRSGRPGREDGAVAQSGPSVSVPRECARRPHRTTGRTSQLRRERSPVGGGLAPSCSCCPSEGRDQDHQRSHTSRPCSSGWSLPDPFPKGHLPVWLRQGPASSSSCGQLRRSRGRDTRRARKSPEMRRQHRNTSSQGSTCHHTDPRSARAPTATSPARS